jgi:RNA polymerase sigma-70 factor (ECF subfamily)
MFFEERLVLEREYGQASEADLARLAGEGDERAFEEIVRRFSGRIFRIAGHFFRRRELVEEAAQDAFVLAYSRIESFNGSGSLEGWLSRIATRVCLNMLRQARRRPETPVSDLCESENGRFERRLYEQSAGAPGSAESCVEQRIVAADLAGKVLVRLSARDRLVLSLIDGQDLSVREAAELTGWSESKVKVQAMRARRRFRQALEKLLAVSEG